MKTLLTRFGVALLVALALCLVVVVAAPQSGGPRTISPKADIIIPTRCTECWESHSELYCWFWYGCGARGGEGGGYGGGGGGGFATAPGQTMTAPVQSPTPAPSRDRRPARRPTKQ